MNTAALAAILRKAPLDLLEREVARRRDAAAEFGGTRLLLAAKRAAVAAVAEAFDVPAVIINSRQRDLRAAQARQTVMALLRELRFSFTEIGRAMSRDHGTAIQAVRRVQARRATDADFDAQFQFILQTLRNR